MFEIIPSENTGLFRFQLKTANGELLLTSIDFTSEQEANAVIESFKTVTLYKTRFERKTTPNGKFHFVLKDTSGKPVAKSPYYTSEAGMQNGMEAVRKYVTQTPP